MEYEYKPLYTLNFENQTDIMNEIFKIVFNYFELIFDFLRKIFPYIIGYLASIFVIISIIYFFVWLYYFIFGESNSRGSQSNPIYFIQEKKPTYYLPGFFAKMPPWIQNIGLFIFSSKRNHSQEDIEIITKSSSDKGYSYKEVDDPFKL